MAVENMFQIPTSVGWNKQVSLTGFVCQVPDSIVANTVVGVCRIISDYSGQFTNFECGGLHVLFSPLPDSPTSPIIAST
jgi:hypothetical protein